MVSTVGVLLITFAVLLFWAWKKRTYNYWKRQGVAQTNPLPFFGDVLDVILLKKTLGQFYEELYSQYKDKKILGYYELTSPCILINDQRIVENIMVKDFSHFVNRDIPKIDSNKSPVDSGLGQLKDSEWRGVRYKLIPAFSSGKLKLMYGIMKNCAKNMLDNIESMPKKGVDIREITTVYALDSIASTAFGIDIRQDSSKNSKFREMGQKILNLDTIGYYFFLLFNLNSKLAQKLGLSLTSGKVGRFFERVIRDTIELRDSSGVKRNDFIDLLLQLRDQGHIEVQSKDPEDSYLKLDYEPTSETFEINDTLLISQAYTFLTAGFDGLSSPVACILYELAKQPDLQERVRADIEQHMSKHGGEMTYEALKSAKLLDCCMNEGLRIYPLTKFLSRECNKDYEIEPGVIIKAGTKVIISNSGFQMDSDFWPEPCKFDPSRFESEITSNVVDFTNLPFGAGPRMCIGMRFAQLIVKVCLATILINYRVKLSANAPNKLTMKIKTFFVNQPADTIPFDLTKIK